MRIKYNNLSQSQGSRVVYFRSTDVEQKNWERLLWSIPDEWFYNWHKGHEVLLFETTTKHHGGKVIKIAIPVIIDILNYILFDQQPLVSNKFKAHYNIAASTIAANTSLKTRIKFWKGLIPNPVTIHTSYNVVEKEPNPLKPNGENNATSMENK